MTTKALLQAAGDGTAVPAVNIGGQYTIGPTSQSMTANNTFNTVLTLDNLPVGTYIVYSAGYSANGGSAHQVCQTRWIVKGTPDSTDGKSALYQVGALGDRCSITS